MIKPKCDKCSEELNDYGAVLISPPTKESMVYKFHLCKSCYEKLIDFIAFDSSK